MIRYADIVFLQDEEGDIITDSLFNVEGVVAHGVTAESFAATLAYLLQWDNGEDHNMLDTLPAGFSDTVLYGNETDPFHNGAYIITANLGLGYVGLVRVINTDTAEEN